MKTMFDFITHIKGVEYLLAIGFIGLFILIWEALSPRPFGVMLATGKDDLNHMRHVGAREAMRTAVHTAAAPFLVIAYVATVPVAFVTGLALSVRHWLANRLAKRRRAE
ncbi:MAG: hypothetical protein OEZ04_02270 [Nitrospinota bacterium]|nr:hypothetical protein [Nitrospinota bacterium]